MTKSILYSIATLLILFGLYFLGALIDNSINPWINGLTLQWWNFFTTGHYLTWLFLHDRISFIIISIIFSGIPAILVFMVFWGKE